MSEFRKKLTRPVLCLAALLAGCGTFRNNERQANQPNRREDSQLAATVRPGDAHSAHRAPATPQLAVAEGSQNQPLNPKLEVVATFDGAMPTGVTVSQKGRVFVCYPKWGDAVPFTVGELRGGVSRAYPDTDINAENAGHPEKSLVSVQSVVVDPIDRLWMLDTGSVNFGKTIDGGPKLVAVDLATDKVVKTILIPPDVALRTTYLNDVRFDLRRGKAGFAFITDSASDGPNGIIVVDLDSGKSWRKLNDHPSTKADKNCTPVVETVPLMTRLPGQAPKPLTMGSDGIAISADGKTLYYCPLISRELYSVSVDALVDPQLPESEVAATVKHVGTKGASDGLETDSEGRLYATDYEHTAILRGTPGGSMETLVHDPRLIWPDTLSISGGYLYFTVNQLDRQSRFRDGKDLRVKPYALFRVKVDAEPVRLAK